MDSHDKLEAVCSALEDGIYCTWHQLFKDVKGSSIDFRCETLDY